MKCWCVAGTSIKEITGFCCRYAGKLSNIACDIDKDVELLAKSTLSVIRFLD